MVETREVGVEREREGGRGERERNYLYVVTVVTRCCMVF